MFKYSDSSLSETLKINLKCAFEASMLSRKSSNVGRRLFYLAMLTRGDAITLSASISVLDEHMNEVVLGGRWCLSQKVV